MEYIENGNLYDLIKKSPNKILPIDKVSHIIKQLVCAIYYLHNITLQLFIEILNQKIFY